MKLAYISIFDPSDIHAWSGTGVYILSALQGAGFQTKTIGNLRYEFDFIYKVKEVLYSRLLSKTYHMLWDPILLKRFAAQVDRALARSNCDVVFSIWTNPIAYLRTDKPIVFWGDAAFSGLMDFYPGYSNLCVETIKDAITSELLALSKCRLAIYSSQWAADTAIQNYAVDPAKVKVVPFGANIECHRSIDDIRANLQDKSFDTCRLLFIGVDWVRKGGNEAAKVASELNQRGIRTELHVVGCNPPAHLPDYVIRHGFISKASTEGSRLLDNLYRQAHFFVLPTRAEAYGIVFAEASSFGLPVLASDIGGIPTIVRDGVNGFTFPLDESPETYSDVIERLWTSRQEYEGLALSSFREYSERLNWKSAGQRVSHLIYEFCG